jgi:hypothetical protein
MKLWHEGHFQVEYDYQPFEAPKGNYPGAEPQITITAVTWNGVDVTEAVVADPVTLDIFSDAALDHALDVRHD